MRLFDRSASRVSLTLQGSLLLEYAKKIATLVSEAERKLEGVDGRLSGPGRSSSGSRVQPTAAFTPSVSNRFAATRTPFSRSASPRPVTFAFQVPTAEIESRESVWSRWSRKSGSENGASFRSGRTPVIQTVRSACAKGSCRKRTPLTTLNNAVLAPIPKRQRENSHGQKSRPFH